ncbi:hypothetical protein [Streptomyces canus]|uniref:MmyB family transcriptional regulator n=1 Tax=Streptomyces canus TaxID=58343 RepID=UPI00039C02A4|nr:hypothetical protein [Streptomyces canus]
MLGEVLAANKPARALAAMYEPGRNVAREMFLGPEARRFFPDRPETAAQTAAALRAEADSPTTPGPSGWWPSWRRTRSSAGCGPGTTYGPPVTSSSGSRTR